VIVSSIAESTFAYFSAAWLLSAPIVVYVLVLDQQVRQAGMAAAKEKTKKMMSDGASPGKKLPQQRKEFCLRHLTDFPTADRFP